MAKAEVRLTYQHLIDSSGWKPVSISPDQFQAKILGAVTDFVTAAADAMNNSKMGRGKAKYRDVVAALYYCPFVRQAPEIKDMWSAEELAPCLEVFLWADWANHRDTKYWLDRIMIATDNVPELKPGIVLEQISKELIDLNPILERLDHCHVDRKFDSEGMPSKDGYRFLNVLWMRNLEPHYKGTLLGDLLESLANTKHQPFQLERRPKSYRLM